MDLFNSYINLYNLAIEEASTITNPYEKATVYTNMMNSLATLISAKAVDNCEEEAECDRDESNVEVSETKIEEPCVVNATEDSAAEEVEAKSNENIIDKASDGADDDEWTERMLEKYAEEINFVQQVMTEFEEEEVNKFVHDATNGLYKSFMEMPPEVFVATYAQLQQALAS